MHPFHKALIQHRDDLTDEEKKQIEEIFTLFKELAEPLLLKDKVIVLNALNLLTEFFMGELQDEKRKMND